MIGTSDYEYNMPQYVGGGTATSSFYHPTPSPADSGVMSPLTPGSNCGASSSSTSSGSPYFSHASPADSGYACNVASASPYALASPSSAAGCGHHEVNHYEHAGGGVGNGGSPLQPPCHGHSSAMGSAAQMQGFWNSPHHLPRHHHREGTFHVRKHENESPSGAARASATIESVFAIAVRRAVPPCP